jgi:hypothetical protein
MDATTRWETEAMRSGGTKRQTPPKPSRKRTEADFSDNRNWVTLKEAEAATGIPTNTLRKWVRRSDLPSYLEADGDLALRMVDLDAVVTRARELGREIVPQSTEIIEPDQHVPLSGETDESSTQGESPGSERGAAEVRNESPEDSTPPPPGTMIVPIDAWNKMLNQLGNLHEAGQQLAEARERAGKAETESKFLRAQLAESRVQPAEIEEPEPRPVFEEPLPGPEPESEETTSYWRYLTTGWRDRKRR